MNSSVLQATKDRERAAQEARTAIAIDRIRNTAVTPVIISGTWKLHRRDSGFVLTRGAGETLQINQHPAGGELVYVTYDAPVDYYPDDDADEDTRQPAEGPD